MVSHWFICVKYYVIWYSYTCIYFEYKHNLYTHIYFYLGACILLGPTVGQTW